jgi:hypothetical protein
MRRWLTLPLAILSLLLCLASAGMWIRSHFFRDILMWVDSRANPHTMQSLLGNLHIISQFDGGSSGNLFYREDRLAPDAIWNGGMSGYPMTINKHLGFVFQNYTVIHPDLSFTGRRGTFTTHHRLIVVPYWFPTFLFAIYPLLWTRSFLKHYFRKLIGHCPRCNYDLRATPNRCPECGWTVESTPSPPI